MRNERSKGIGAQLRSAPLVSDQVAVSGTGKAFVGRNTDFGAGWFGSARSVHDRAREPRVIPVGQLSTVSIRTKYRGNLVAGVVVSVLSLLSTYGLKQEGQ